jgi:hypothetical protein
VIVHQVPCRFGEIATARPSPSIIKSSPSQPSSQRRQQQQQQQWPASKPIRQTAKFPRRRTRTHTHTHTHTRRRTDDIRPGGCDEQSRFLCQHPPRTRARARHTATSSLFPLRQRPTLISCYFSTSTRALARSLAQAAQARYSRSFFRRVPPDDHGRLLATHCAGLSAIPSPLTKPRQRGNACRRRRRRAR